MTPPPHPIRIGTRGSQLALTQARMVDGLLQSRHPHLRTELVVVQTQGDRALDAPLTGIGGKGVFTREIETALLDGRIDLAVHSLKDLPTGDPPGLRIGCIPKRASPADVLIATAADTLDHFPPGGIIGTSSPRRAAQIRRILTNAEIRDLRGNVPTRLRKLAENAFNAIVLAEAGIQRLGLHPQFLRRLTFDEMLPAPGQGAIAVQIRDDDQALAALLAPLSDPATTACCRAERALLHHLGAGCHAPLGAIAEIRDGMRLVLRARVLSPDGSAAFDCHVEGTPDAPEELGAKAAQILSDRGVRTVIDAAASARAPASKADGFEHEISTADGNRREVRVLVTRDEDADGPLSRLLRQHGMTPVSLPLVRTSLRPPAGSLIPALESATAPDWIVLSSAKAAAALLEALSHQPGLRSRLRTTRFACVGPATASLLQAREIEPAIIGPAGRDALLARLVPQIIPGQTCLVLLGSLSPRHVSEALSAAGARVIETTVYDSQPLPQNAAHLAALLRQGGWSAIAICSASAVEAFASARPDPASLPAIASIGASTSAALSAAGHAVAVEAPEPTLPALADALAQFIHSNSSPATEPRQ